jgi:hypothetical protein
MANNLLLFICSTATGVYDDTGDTDLLSLSLSFYDHENETTLKNNDPGYKRKS